MLSGAPQGVGLLTCCERAPSVRLRSEIARRLPMGVRHSRRSGPKPGRTSSPPRCSFNAPIAVGWRFMVARRAESQRASRAHIIAGRRLLPSVRACGTASAWATGGREKKTARRGRDRAGRRRGGGGVPRRSRRPAAAGQRGRAATARRAVAGGAPPSNVALRAAAPALARRGVSSSTGRGPRRGRGGASWRCAGAVLQVALLMNAGDHRPPRRAAAQVSRVAKN